MIDGKLSLVLPAHNESANVETVIADAVWILPRFARDFEVIVVDDGSVDGTGALARYHADADPRVRVIGHHENRGYGAALRTGFAASTGDWVMVMDSDRQFDPGDLVYLAPLAGSYDLVAGYRIQRSDPAHRTVFGKIFRLAMRVLFGVQLYDIDCAFKLIRGDPLRSLSLESDGAMISTELMARWARMGASWTQVGVHHYPRTAGQQSGGSLSVIVRAVRDVPALWYRLNREPAPTVVHDGGSHSTGITPVHAARAGGVVLLFGVLLAWMIRRGRDS